MADPVLPAQTPGTLAEKIEQVREQQALLARMREDAGNDPQATRAADTLAAQYHARDVADLAKDVYRSAAHEKAPDSLGWLRASEHPELLEKAGVHWSKQQLHEFLQPNNSDCRAEIYLPDPKVYGSPPSVQPVLAFKGSNGGVALPGAVPGPDGKVPTRESALEDWVENARQGIGLKSNHYDRSMDVAVALQNALGPKSPFEITGHSKGGGQATAAAAVTGMPTYTFNAASLHPDTATRYAGEHGLQTFAVDPLVHAYHVKGEVLHDALSGVHGMDAATRAQLGKAAERFGELSQIGDVRTLARGELAKALPYDPKMQEDALGLLNHLATHSGKEALKGVPLPSGSDQIELAPKARDAAGRIVDRPAQPSLGAVANDAGPLMDVVSGALAYGVAGKRVGDTIAGGGRVFEQGTQLAGSTSRTLWEMSGRVVDANVRGNGQVLGASIHYGGEAVAGMRLAGGHAEALVDRAQGKVATWTNDANSSILRTASHLPFLGNLREVAERNDRETAAFADAKRAEAAAALKEARQDASGIRRTADDGAGLVVRGSSALGGTLDDGARRVGGTVDGAYRGVGETVRGATDRAPAVGAGIGLLGGTVVNVKDVYLSLPYGPFNQYETYRFATQAKGAAGEAVNRHAMQEVVFPSLDARTRQMEDDALKRIRDVQPAHAPTQPVTPSPDRTGLRIDDPNHPAFRLYQDASRGIERQDALVGRTPDLRSRQLSGALAAEAFVAGMPNIDHVRMSADAKNTFGVRGSPDDPAHARVSVDTVTAMNTPLAKSGERAATVEAPRAQTPTPDLQETLARPALRAQ